MSITRFRGAAVVLAMAAAAVCAACSDGTASASPAGPAETEASIASATASGALAVGPSAVAPGTVGVVAGQVPHGQGRIIVTLEGTDIPVDNGARVDLGSGVVVELFLDPFPPATLSVLMDVYLEVDGRLADDGFVGIDYDMLAMEHGPFSGSGESIGGGHFVVPLDYIMFGAWEQVLTIRANDRRVRLPVVIVARP